MLENVERYHYPSSVREAVGLLEKYGSNALLVAGGTSASRSNDEKVTDIIDLTRMGAGEIRRHGDGWALGCAVRVQQVASHEGLRGYLGGMLCEAAAAIGSRPIRNMVTVGGNAVQLYRWSDLPPALVAASAEFVIEGPSGSRVVGADEFFGRHPRQVLERAEILAEVRLPARRAAAGAFVKIARTSFDFAIASAAAVVEMEGGRISGLRLVLGGLRVLPWLAEEAARFLRGRKRLAGSAMDELSAYVMEKCPSVSDVRTSADYRRRIAGVAARRAVEQAWLRARELA